MKKYDNKTIEKLIFRYLNIRNFEISKFQSFYSSSFKILTPTRSLMFGLQKIVFFCIFRKYNILRVYCKNFRPKYEIFTKLQYIVESAPRLIN